MAATKSTRDKTQPNGIKSAPFTVLGIGLLAVAAWYWSTSRATPPVEAFHAVKGTLHLETFVINLADREQRSYLRVGIDLGLAREIGKKENAPVGEVRDTVLGVLALAKVDELLTAAGKAKLKQDLLGALQERISGLEVQDVYFTEFLIQR